MPSDPENPEDSHEAARRIVETTLHIRAAHEQDSHPLQRAVDRVTAFVGRPAFVIALLCIIAGWITENLVLRHMGLRPLDPPPFVWLSEAVSVVSLFVSISILATQRREDRLAERRAHLVVELLVVNDRKISKIIQLLEEMRRDSPVIKDRVDGEALSMATPSDPTAVLRAIKEVAEEPP